MFFLVEAYYCFNLIWTFFPLIVCGTGNSIWGYGNSKSRLICMAQNKAVRIEFGPDTTFSCRSEYRGNNILTFTSHYFLTGLSILRKINPKLFPSCLKHYFRVPDVSAVPSRKTTFLEYQTFCSPITTCNKLPSLLKEKNAYLKNLKYFLFD